MPIEEYMKVLQEVPKVMPITKESINVALETMRKYQKIQEIIADWRSDGGAFEMSESYWLRLISEVVEDG